MMWIIVELKAQRKIVTNVDPAIPFCALFVKEYSGITADLLDGVSTSLEEVQVALLGLICKEDIVVGHSLENDLHALRLSHPRVIDTAVLFRTDGRKHALR